ncbi:MAG TPA: hypothetical protein PKY82_21110 [Pyrinomonadaceae bacterium]|nr:hypothetical protein [Pyrinomonadaceae bacterium]
MVSIEEKKDLLCQAINSRMLVQFKYDGRSRIVEPFCCGVITAGNYVLRGFQIRGADKTKPLCWRLYELSEMSQLNITQHTFNGKRVEYQSNDSAMAEIFCCI